MGFARQDVLVILNPASGRAEAGDLARSLERALQEADAARVVVRRTGAIDDAIRWARDAAAEGFGALLVGGGDGTVAAAATGVLEGGADLPIGILPIGTGNGLAHMLRLPTDPLKSVRALDAGRPVRVDAIEVPSHDRVGLVFAGAGLDAEVNRDADAASKRRFGTLAYAASTVRNLVGRRNQRLSLTLDGHRMELVGHAVSVFNAGIIEIAGLEFGPPANPHDGRLDVAVFRSPSFPAAAGQVLRLLIGRPKRAELVGATHVRLEADPPMPVHVDGDVVGTTPLEARVRPGALCFLAAASYRPPSG